MLQVLFEGTQGDRKFIFLPQFGWKSGVHVARHCKNVFYSFFNLVAETYRVPALLQRVLGHLVICAFHHLPIFMGREEHMGIDC